MATRDLTCPVCQADIPMGGDEGVGDEIYCTFCGAPCRVAKSSDGEQLEAEEDF